MIGDIYAYLKKHGKEIAKEAKEGNELCKRIMSTYKLHYDCPSDLGAQGILKELIIEYIKKN
jgi:hypothetical protein